MRGAVAGALLVAAVGLAQEAPVRLRLDASDVSRRLLHAQMTMAVKPGPLTLLYPQWIPGEHGPTGPIDNVAGLEFEANGQRVPWKRDNINMFAFHLTVPDNTSELNAKVDFLATAQPTGF